MIRERDLHVLQWLLGIGLVVAAVATQGAQDLGLVIALAALYIGCILTRLLGRIGKDSRRP